MPKLYPLKFETIYKEKIWGGKKLKEKFSKEIPSPKTGESWEITDNKSGVSIVKNGKLSGKTLNQLIKMYGKNLLGNNVPIRENFPLLIKFIDANRKLSVQVHPFDNFAKKLNEKNGKTEMWYVLAAEKNAKLVYGLDSEINTEKLKKATQNGKLKPYLREVKVKAGDFFFIPGGTVHAIEEGILLAEIQQNSDTTYRLYDWDRTDEDGNSRPLHIKKAFDVINSVSQKNKNPKNEKDIFYENNNYKQKFLTVSPYFAVEHISLKNNFNFKPAHKKFHIIINLRGDLSLKADNKNYKLQPGETILIPASLKSVKIEGDGEFLRTYIP
ncbi:MAG: type I phosphomannose isomerase catalytic subunit, partial [Bacillota bacterium]